MGTVIAKGDLVASQVSWTARHTGDFMGIPASGNQISVTETHFDRVRDGKIVEHGGDWDQLGLMRALGAVPTPS